MAKTKKLHKEPSHTERRQYIRLDVAFPVEFQFLDPETGGSISDIKQGFTRDIGKGGVCLEVNNSEEAFEDTLKAKKAHLDLRIHIPLSHRETKAIASIAWYKKVKSGYPNKYLIGLSFIDIDKRESSRIYFHARRMSLTPKIVTIIILFLIAGLVFFYSSDYKSRLENKKLIAQLVSLSGKKSKLEKDILDYDVEYREIEETLLSKQEKIAAHQTELEGLRELSLELEEKTKLLEYSEQDRLKTEQGLEDVLSEKDMLAEKVSSLTEEVTYLKQRISQLSKNRISVEDSLKELLASFVEVEEKGLSSMYSWVKKHQNNITGLVVSYEGDKGVEDWAFTYDQSLACQCFILMGDKDNARAVLDFYKHRAEKVYGGFANAYDAYTGSVTEYTVHAGPNIWLGIAMIRYAERFKDEEYLRIAQKIGEWLIKLQREDKEFGIRGGPQFRWFSTEHNLDAYAFFNMLYKLTGEQKYLESKDLVFKWIEKNTFLRREGRLKRGKGDATIATDTFAWAIAAVGPELLKDSGMDPDQIIDFAEANCMVTTDYKRPGGKALEVTGFDFGKYEHLPRGGIVSTEWTAQMVVTLKIMARYHEDNNDFLKAAYYKNKADFYLSELQKMMIVSPSKMGQGEGCLPYASQDNVDTGHGWRAPDGSRTGSASGTIYTIFAKENYNPLRSD